jgi:hypothetical protein
MPMGMRQKSAMHFKGRDIGATFVGCVDVGSFVKKRRDKGSYTLLEFATSARRCTLAHQKRRTHESTGRWTSDARHLQNNSIMYWLNDI